MKNIIIDNKKLELKEAKTFFQRLFGFMGKKNISYALLFKKTNSIHTFFMKTPIDVIAIDEDNKVIFKGENIPKNKIINIKHPIKKTSIIELPSNTSHNLKIGKKLTFECE